MRVSPCSPTTKEKEFKKTNLDKSFKCKKCDYDIEECKTIKTCQAARSLLNSLNF